MTREKLNSLISAIKYVRSAVDDKTALDAKGLYPEWKTDTAYSVGDRVLYDGTLYKCLQSHTSQQAWTPTDAVSLWAEVLIPDPTIIPEWIQPDSTNPYMTGDKVTHNGYIWVSLVDNNVWEPSDALPTLWSKEDTA